LLLSKDKQLPLPVLIYNIERKLWLETKFVFPFLSSFRVACVYLMQNMLTTFPV